MLLGKSAAERQAISKQMKSFYRTRSKVVHGTASKNPRKRERELAGAPQVRSGTRSPHAILPARSRSDQQERMGSARAVGAGNHMRPATSPSLQVVPHVQTEALRFRRL